jgi:hypothetical protein
VWYIYPWLNEAPGPFPTFQVGRGGGGKERRCVASKLGRNQPSTTEDDDSDDGFPQLFDLEVCLSIYVRRVRVS